VTELDELAIQVVVDNETDTLSSVDEGVPQVPRKIRRSDTGLSYFSGK
jgi:7,8-dihydropterin-6-yl-methyl-4-(beta-D-ribofuranosyl)aminobenzene 5'-phosphate synthase